MALLTSVQERLKKIKRRWTSDYPAVYINPEAKMRNKIVKFVGDGNLHRVKYSELKEFFKELEEDDEIGRQPSNSWISKNKHILKKVKLGSVEYVRLTKLGKRIYNYLEGDSVDESADVTVDPDHIRPVSNLVVREVMRRNKNGEERLMGYLIGEHDGTVDGAKDVAEKMNRVMPTGSSKSLSRTGVTDEEGMPLLVLNEDCEVADQKAMDSYLPRLFEGIIEPPQNQGRFVKDYLDRLKSARQEGRPTKVAGIIFRPPVFNTGHSRQAPPRATDQPAGTSEGKEENVRKAKIVKGYYKGRDAIIKGSSLGSGMHRVAVLDENGREVHNAVWHESFFDIKEDVNEEDDVVADYNRLATQAIDDRLEEIATIIDKDILESAPPEKIDEIKAYLMEMYVKGFEEAGRELNAD